MILVRPGVRPTPFFLPLAASAVLAAALAGVPATAAPARASAAPPTAAPASATASVPADPADPADASRPVPLLEHRSVLGSYRSAHEVPPVDWRTANQTVNRIGGWRAYAREAASPAPVAPAAPAASAPAKEGRR